MSLISKRNVFGSVWWGCHLGLYKYTFTRRFTKTLSDSSKSNKDKNKDAKKHTNF
jgi:hypothetical protein